MNTKTVKKLSHGVIEAMEGITAKSVGGAKNRHWTRKVKKVIGRIGRENGFTVSASGFKGKCDPEWLYDLVWYRNNTNERLEALPLILECEWIESKDSIRWDFERLLIANAPLKVMVFQCRGERKMEDLFKMLKDSVNEFKHGGFATYILA